MTLKKLLTSNKILLAPGVFDGLSALIAEKSGAAAVYLSGASFAYTRFGRPDVGLVTMSEVAENIALIRDRISLPIIVDADTGFGNALNVQRTVRVFERCGANCLQLEDQSIPKRCGHLQGKSLIKQAEMVGKIRAACDARLSRDTLIIARTDAIAVDGFDSAMNRSDAYLAAGADILFIEAPQSITEMQMISNIFGKRAPLMANMVEGGKSPSLTADELHKMGFSLVIFPGGLVRALAKTCEDYFSNLLKEGSNMKFLNRMHDLSSLNELLGTSHLLDKGKEYDQG